MHAAPYPAIDQRFGDWLAGFIDGEGCFNIAATYRGASHQAFQCTFVISLRSDDREILELIRATTGLGRLSALRPSVLGNPSVEWRVADKAGCVRLSVILDEHPLRAKKARDFAVWRQAVAYWARLRRPPPGEHNDWSAIEQLHRQLIDGRAYAPPPPRPEPEQPPTLWE